jgi:hypothetical protein
MQCCTQQPVKSKGTVNLTCGTPSIVRFHDGGHSASVALRPAGRLNLAPFASSGTHTGGPRPIPPFDVSGTLALENHPLPPVYGPWISAVLQPFNPHWQAVQGRVSLLGGCPPEFTKTAAVGVPSRAGGDESGRELRRCTPRTLGSAKGGGGGNDAVNE